MQLTDDEARKSVTHRFVDVSGAVAWRTETEIGIDCQGFTWTGTIDDFETLWSEEDSQ